MILTITANSLLYNKESKLFTVAEWAQRGAVYITQLSIVQ
jgi:hypothetical protein